VVVRASNDSFNRRLRVTKMSHDSDIRLIDVTVLVSEGLPVWPGDPKVRVAAVSRIAAGDLFNVSAARMSFHTGTHVDAPWHVDDAGTRLDDIPIERWIGPCWVAEIPSGVETIEPEHLIAAAIPDGTDRLLFRTANSGYWQTIDHPFVTDFVSLSAAGAQWIVDRGIHLVGIDYLSIECADDVTGLTHRTLLTNDVLIVEGLNLARVEPGRYTMICLPLRLVAGDGAPARVVLVADQSHSSSR